MRFQWRLVGAILTLALVITACGGGATPSESEQEVVKLTVIVLPFLGYVPFYIAESEGYFTEQNLDVEFLKADSANRLLPSFIQGDFDVWAGTLGPGAFNAINVGARIKIVAGKGYIDPSGCPYYALVARSDFESGEPGDVAQLENSTVGFRSPPSITGSYFLDQLTDLGGVDDESLEMHAIPTPALAEALGDGVIDFTLPTEPWLTRILDAGTGVIWYRANEAIPDYQIAYTMFGTRLLDENPDAGRRFMVAYLKAIRQYNEGKTERNLDIIVDATELDRDLLERACWSQIRSDGRLDVESVRSTLEWAFEQGMVDAVLDGGQFWDPSFVEYANQVLGEPGE